MKELSLNILDIVQNSIRAKAHEISIEINESAKNDFYRIIITDNGNGISKEMLLKVTDPYVTSRTKRKIGLGLPLLEYHAEITGGTVEIRSEEGKGTEIIANLSFSHIDRQPLGDIVGVILILIAANPGINFTFKHTTDIGEYRFSSKETITYLEVNDLSDRILLKSIGNMIGENLKALEVSGLFFQDKT